MLQLRPDCECCDADLPPDSGDAPICSFECTFCRPAELLERYPTSTQRVVKKGGCATAA
jgi:hypothetical protein